MYIQTINTKQGGKVYPSIVLCRSYRKNGKQKRQILATLTKWPPELVDALRKALKGKTITSLEDMNATQGKSYGALYMLYYAARQIGLEKILGRSRQGRLALLQVLARCIDPSSRLHIANYWPDHYEIEAIGIKDKFTEDDLYNNLDWLAANQSKIEKKLFTKKYPNSKVSQLYLYDITSSYFEGTKNKLAAYGYNRDKKQGKKQIVIGLMCDSQGDPISIEVFEGNTSDMSTLNSQLSKLKDEFGVEQVIMVGDKGMIKSKQIDKIKKLEWNYITSITKAQIRSLIKKQVIQIGLFDNEVVEVQDGDVRYILRKNPIRAEQIHQNRKERIDKVNTIVESENLRMIDQPGADIEKSKKNIEKKIKGFKLHKCLTITVQDRKMTVNTDQDVLNSMAMLDGCYVIKTEVLTTQSNTQMIHDRYKDLSKVEFAFRTIKTGLEEIRPIYVRLESRTRGHVFVCMLAYKLIKHLKSLISKNKNLKAIPTKQIIKSMEAIHYTQYDYEGKKIKVLPMTYNLLQEQVLKTIELKLPTKLYAK